MRRRRAQGARLRALPYAKGGSLASAPNPSGRQETQLGKVAVTTQTQFTQSEWETLQFAPLWMLSGVGGADANIEELEIAALMKEISEAALYKNQLVREVLFSIAADAGILDRYRDDPRTIDHGLSQVADVLEAHLDPVQALEFKKTMLGIGLEIAKAAGPLFGSSVSAQERAALGWAAAAMRVQS